MFSAGEALMGRWRGKILFTLIVYCSGFLTAVYFLAPVSAAALPETQSEGQLSRLPAGEAFSGSAGIDYPAWAASIRSGIDICIRFAEENALRAADLFRSKMGQSSQSDRHE